jgi:hypothetical protein
VAAFLDHLADATDLSLAAAVEARAALLSLSEVVLRRPLADLSTAVGRLREPVLGDLRPRPDGEGSRLFDPMRHILRVRPSSLSTEECSIHWARRSILFHGKRHPRDLGNSHVTPFLTHLAVQGQVSVSTQRQALNALVFLDKQVLAIDLGSLEHVRATCSARLPVVASRDEVRRVIEAVRSWCAEARATRTGLS